jgi:AraC-like DNA-binding protein
MNADSRPDTAASDYREYAAPASLAGRVLCVWTQTVAGSGEGFAQRVMPDGCVDIVLINDEPPAVVGPWTEPFIARLAAGTSIVAARFHPGFAPALLGVPASELLNQSVPLGTVRRGMVSRRFERVVDACGIRARRAELEAALIERLADAGPVDKAIRAAIRWLADHPQGRIEQLAQWVGISGRQLQRRFIAAVGYGPKTFQSVLRFQRLLNFSARAGAPIQLAQAAADAGYADQAHMTREVRRFSGSAPSALLQSARSALQLSGLLDPARY